MGALTDLGTALNQQPVAPDLNSQVVCHRNHPRRKGAVLAVHNALDCWTVDLARPYEAIASKTLLRLRCHEARLVIV